MILVWGKAGDAPIDAVLQSLAAGDIEHIHIDEAAQEGMHWDVEIGTAAGWLKIGGRRVPLQSISGIYLRPWQPASGTGERAATILLALAATLPCAVVNRPAAGRSNASKPYQIGLIEKAGLAVPATLVTSDESKAREFLRQQGSVVYKSLSGIRSIVGLLGPGDEARFSSIGTGPLQLQAYVPGIDVRVHVVAGRCFACSVKSDAIDYRYPIGPGQTPRLESYELPLWLEQRLVGIARSMDLAIAGIDLRVQPTGDWICFEVNPSPGFTWYENATGHPIAGAIVDFLRCGITARPLETPAGAGTKQPRIQHRLNAPA